MRITKTQLKRVIREELEKVLAEGELLPEVVQKGGTQLLNEIADPISAFFVMAGAQAWLMSMWFYFSHEALKITTPEDIAAYFAKQLRVDQKTGKLDQSDIDTFVAASPPKIRRHLEKFVENPQLAVSHTGQHPLLPDVSGDKGHYSAGYRAVADQGDDYGAWRSDGPRDVVDPELFAKLAQAAVDKTIRAEFKKADNGDVKAARELVRVLRDASGRRAHPLSLGRKDAEWRKRFDTQLMAAKEILRNLDPDALGIDSPEDPEGKIRFVNEKKSLTKLQLKEIIKEEINSLLDEAWKVGC